MTNKRIKDVIDVSHIWHVCYHHSFIPVAHVERITNKNLLPPTQAKSSVASMSYDNCNYLLSKLFPDNKRAALLGIFLKTPDGRIIAHEDTENGKIVTVYNF